MSTPVSRAVPGADSVGTGPHSGGRRPAPSERPPPAPAAEETPPPDTGQRLTIRAVGDSYVYTVLDRRSGQVVAEVSRDEVAHMGQMAGYAAGSLIKAKA